MTGGTSCPTEVPGSEEDGFYAVILTNKKIDRFGHNGVFAKEITVAFEKLKIPLRELDYLVHIREVFEALKDRRCLFFLCFNGFGSELMLPVGAPGHLRSSFEVFGKPLFDLMHDCPSGEPMAHQIESRSRARMVLLTDYGYVQDAQELGFPNVRFVPSITFPCTLPQHQKVSRDRSIKVLLPVNMMPAEVVWDRHGGEHNYRRCIYREIFATITDRCSIDLQLDPRIETRAACREAGVAFERPSRRLTLSPHVGGGCGQVPSTIFADESPAKASSNRRGRMADRGRVPEWTLRIQPCQVVQRIAEHDGEFASCVVSLAAYDGLPRTCSRRIHRGRSRRGRPQCRVGN